MHAYECICIDLQHEYAALTLREECVWGYLLVVDVEFYLSGHIALYLDADMCFTFNVVILGYLGNYIPVLG